MNQTTFSVTSNSRKNDRFDYKPKVVGHFSLDANRSYSNDLSQLKYILYPEKDDMDVAYDLEAGRDKAITVGDEKHDVIDNILRWITESFRKEKWDPPDFVCMRGMLNKFLATPYEKKNGWIVDAMRWKGTIYLCEKETAEKRHSIEQRTDGWKQLFSWGFKFEQYMCSDEPGGVPDTSLPVKEPEGLRVIFRARLNSHHLLFGADVDGVKSNTKINNCSDLARAEFVELKTHWEITNKGQEHFFRRSRLMHWWGQCYLTGTRHIVSGFRDDKGMVHRLKCYKTSDLHRMAVGWTHRVCMSFCSRFLDFIKRLVVEEDLNIIWRFEWKPNQEVTAERILGPSEFAFLPEWFTSSFPSQQQG